MSKKNRNLTGQFEMTEIQSNGVPRHKSSWYAELDGMWAAIEERDDGYYNEWWVWFVITDGGQIINCNAWFDSPEDAFVSFEEWYLGDRNKKQLFGRCYEARTTKRHEESECSAG